MIKDVAGRLFRKSISLLEERLHVKIRNAVLIIDTEEYGEHTFQLKENEGEVLILMSRSFHRKMIDTLSRTRYIAGMDTCSRCLGTGRASMDDYESCPICKGGGQVVLVDPNFKTAQYEPSRGNDEQIQIPEREQ